MWYNAVSDSFREGALFMDTLFLNARVCTPFELRDGAVLVRDGIIEGVLAAFKPTDSLGAIIV